MSVDFSSMIGRVLSSITLDGPASTVTFNYEDGESRSFTVEGDCCSHSWIEHLEMPSKIEGATILSVEDSAPVSQDHDGHDEENGGDSIEVYNTSFRTNRGEVILEYRNSSNGYYGGYLVDVCPA